MNPPRLVSHLDRIFSACLLTALLLCSQARAEYKVLFLGNSFTYGKGGVASVPAIFDALAIAGEQEDPLTEMRAMGGTNFQFHCKTSAEIITQQQWTHVILQNHSTQPTNIGNVAAHRNSGAQLYGAVIANNPETKVFLYQTWSRGAVHPLVSGTSTSKTFGSTDEMLDELRTNYQSLAESLTAENPELPPVGVIPVGDSWKNAGGNLPPTDPRFINLFTSDHYHGNDRGYYLSACVHYAMIYGSSPVGLFTKPSVSALNLPISPEDAAFLEKIAWDTVRSQTGS